MPQSAVNIGLVGHIDHGKCVSTDSFILINNDVLTGEELVRLAEEKGTLIKKDGEGKFYDVGLHAYCFDNKLDLVRTKAFVYIQPYTGKMVRVHTASGRELTATPNHPFLVNRWGELEWVHASTLKVGEYISALKKINLHEGVGFRDYINDLRKTHIVVDAKRFDELRDQTKNFTEFDKCTDEELNEIRVLYGFSGNDLANKLSVSKQHLTDSFNDRGLSKRLKEKIIKLFLSSPKPKLNTDVLITCSRKDSGSMLSFKDARLSPSLMKWIAFVCAEGGKGKNRLRVTQKNYMNLLGEFFDISMKEFGIRFRKVSEIDYEFCGRAFMCYIGKKFHISVGTSRESPIPSWLLSANRELQRIFLRWFITLEGEFNKDSIVVTQANKKSIQVLALLAMNNGIRPILSRRNSCATNGTKIKREYFQLKISGKDNLVEFLEKIGVENKEVERKISRYLTRIENRSKDSSFVIPINYLVLKELLLKLGMKIDKVGAWDGTGECRRKLIKRRKWYYALPPCRVRNTVSEKMFEMMLPDLEKRISELETLLATNDFVPLKHEFRISLRLLARELGVGKTTLGRWKKQNRPEVLQKLKEICVRRLQEARRKLDELKAVFSEHVFYDRVTKIEKIPYNGRVVDLAVPTHNNFISGFGGIISHNTSLTEALSGVWTDTHSEEIRRGITIRLGYADTSFMHCQECGRYSTKEKCPYCESPTELVRRVSFVDAPGHEMLMATMISGAAVMDGAILVVAANEPCPQPQTKEHLMVLDIIGVRNLVVAQNKVELVSREKVVENYKQIKDFLAGTFAADAPIIPISAVHRANIDKLIQAIEEHIPTPKRDPIKHPRMYVTRSFDVNRPGTKPEKLVGGVLGGSLLQGKLKVGDEVEIRPGIKVSREGRTTWQHLNSKVVSLHTMDSSLEEALPGGLIGVGTLLDPSMTKGDSLVGSVLGAPGTLPEVLDTLELEVHLMKRVVGLQEELDVKPLVTGEPLMMNIGTASTVGTITSARKDKATVKLKIPVCAEQGARAALSRRVAGRWRLIGYAIIT